MGVGIPPLREPPDLVDFFFNLQGFEVIKLWLMGLEFCEVAILIWVGLQVGPFIIGRTRPLRDMNRERRTHNWLKQGQ